MTPTSRRPFYSSITIIILLPLAVFLINVILMFLLGPRTLVEYKMDNILHGVGGASVCLSSAGVLWHLIRRKIITLKDENVFRFVVFGFLCFVVIGWEILEYVIFSPHEFLTYADTISDMICGLIGGLFVVTVFRKTVFSVNSF